MYRLSEMTRTNIEHVVGLDFDKIKSLSFDEQQNWIQQRIHKKIVFSKNKRAGIAGRGNPLLARRKFRTSDDLNAKSKKYIGI